MSSFSVPAHMSPCGRFLQFAAASQQIPLNRQSHPAYSPPTMRRLLSCSQLDGSMMLSSLPIPYSEGQVMRALDQSRSPRACNSAPH